MLAHHEVAVAIGLAIVAGMVVHIVGAQGAHHYRAVVALEPVKDPAHLLRLEVEEDAAAGHHHVKALHAWQRPEHIEHIFHCAHLAWPALEIDVAAGVHPVRTVAGDNSGVPQVSQGLGEAVVHITCIANEQYLHRSIFYYKQCKFSANREQNKIINEVFFIFI